MLDAEALHSAAMKAHAAQDIPAALEAITAAAALAPEHPAVALALAQIRYEAGLAAADQFAAAARLLPDRPEIARNHGLALVAEGEEAAGLARLEAVVAAKPRWIEGLRTLAGLRTTLGHADFTAGYARAVKALPMEPALWLAWFQALAQARQWREAGEVLNSAAAVLGAIRPITLARLYLASESGEGADDPNLFDAVAGVEDPGLDLARVRHFLRGGQVERASDVAMAYLGRPTIRMFWPYLSLTWRLLEDERAAWLDRGMDDVGVHDLALSPADLTELAELLRGLHRARAPWHDQSVRGGTQTDRPLLLRVDPVILRVRHAIEVAVRAHVANLSPPDPAHPLLAAPRDKFRLAGSWSVRLSAGGFHAPHTHPGGWLSSAAYIALPENGPEGRGDAGHLAFGTPPPELRLPLDRHGTVRPRPGRLVLFPSTTWHGTVPFSGQERLTIAFDVVPA